MELDYVPYEAPEPTEEQLAAREARKARKLEEAREAVREDLASLDRWKIDVPATLAMLIELKKVRPTFANGKNEKQLEKWVRTACGAYEVMAISLLGTEINCNLIARRACF